MAFNPNNPYIPGDPYSYDLKWIVTEIKKAILEFIGIHGQIADLNAALDDLTEYVKTYFDHLDISQAVSDKLDEMYEDGTLKELLRPYIAEIVAPGINFYGVQTSHIVTDIGNYWLVKIPRVNSLGEKLELKVGISDNTVTSPTWETDLLTVGEFSMQKKASVAINAGFFYTDEEGNPPMGSVIIDGEILINQYDSHTTPLQALGIKADGSWHYYDANTVNAVEMVDDGVVYAVEGLGAMVAESAKTAALPIWNNRYSRGRWQTIGCNEDYYFVITTEKREPEKLGYSLDDIANIYLELGATDAYICDGGGSCSTTVEGIKLNDNIDGAGLVDRKVCTFFYITKPALSDDPEFDQDVSLSRALSSVLSFMRSQGAKLKRYMLNTNLGGEFNDCNLLPLNTVGYTYPESLNSPGAYYHIFTYGYSNDLKVQLAIRHTDSRLMTRSLQGGNWRPWRTHVGWSFPTDLTDPDTLTPESAYYSPTGNTHNPDAAAAWFILTLGNSASSQYMQLAVRETSARQATRLHTSSGWTRWDIDMGGTVNASPNSTDTLADLGLVVNNGVYLVMMQRTGTYNESASMYIIRYLNGAFGALTTIHEGTLATAPRLTADGIVKAGGTGSAAFDYSVRLIRIS